MTLLIARQNADGSRELWADKRSTLGGQRIWSQKELKIVELKNFYFTTTGMCGTSSILETLDKVITDGVAVLPPAAQSEHRPLDLIVNLTEVFDNTYNLVFLINEITRSLGYDQILAREYEQEAVLAGVIVPKNKPGIISYTAQTRGVFIDKWRDEWHVDGCGCFQAQVLIEAGIHPSKIFPIVSKFDGGVGAEFDYVKIPAPVKEKEETVKKTTKKKK
jgi:hypothetical protein